MQQPKDKIIKSTINEDGSIKIDYTLQVKSSLEFVKIEFSGVDLGLDLKEKTMKYGVYGGSGWCYGTGNFPSREFFQGERNFCTTDLNFAFQYHEDITRRNSGSSYTYEVREIKQ